VGSVVGVGVCVCVREEVGVVEVVEVGGKK